MKSTKDSIEQCKRTVQEKIKKIDEDEICYRKIVQHFVLIATNSGLGIGELKQLKWDDVIIERRKNKTGSEIKTGSDKRKGRNKKSQKK